MTHEYNISGMTCNGCSEKVRSKLLKVPGVKNIIIDLSKNAASIEMDRHISTPTLQQALKDDPWYILSVGSKAMELPSNEHPGEFKSWGETYKPILLIFAYITAIALIAGFQGDGFNILQAMRIFMAGFFITFSFFKMLDLGGFADSYASYDIVAKKFRIWGYLYAFIELGLGLAYAIDFRPLATNYATLVVMSLSIIGVLQSVLNKRKIKCACLGAVFNLPMSTVTVTEDALMIVMSIAMIAMLQ